MKKYSEILTVILFCTMLASLSVLFVLIPDKAVSQTENRSLAQAPKFEKDTFLSGDFAKETNIYFSDQFPMRNMFVKLKSFGELAMLKGENNGVLFSKNQLAVKDFNAYKSILEITNDTQRIYTQSAEAQIKNAYALGEKLNIPFITVIPPRTIDIADGIFDYNRPEGDFIFNTAKEIFNGKGIYIDTLTPLREKYENNEYVYYRTDHHWTTLGAYYSYCDIMKSLGKEDKIIDINSFEIEQIHDFSGTTAAKGNFPFYKKDIIEIWHLPDDGEYEVIADGENLGGFYSRSHLETSDKYSVFLDGTHNITTIKKVGAERETLVIVKDSFANCLIPFLAREYDIIAVNIHTFNAVSSMAENYNAAAVLVVCNGENIITAGDLGKLK